MKIFLLVISVFWLLAGLVFLIFPLKSKTFYTKLIKPTKPLFILPLLAGILFLWAHPASRLQLFIKLLGIISLIKALFILISPRNTLISTFNYFTSRPLIAWRVYGVFTVVLGVVVMFSIL